MSVSEIEQAFGAKRVALAELGATVKIDLGTDTIFIDGTKSPAVLSHDDQDADCTLAISPENLQKIMNGELDATMAFMTGKLKVRGSTNVAMKLAGILR